MLFKTSEAKHGGDLVAFNVWRGRDHGLPGYNTYRQLCGMKKVKGFSELNDVFTPDVIVTILFENLNIHLNIFFLGD